MKNVTSYSSIILKILFIFLCITACKKKDEGNIDSFLPIPPNGYSWIKVFQDDFDGNVLDSSKWIIWNGDRTESVSRPEAVTINLSTIRINQYYDSIQRKYTSAFVGTLGKFEQAYGFYSARIRVNKISGWDAGFWLLGQGVGNIGNGGVDGSEIDIIEMPFQNDSLLHAIHWDGYGAEHQSAYKIVKMPNVKVGEWHIFSLCWLEDKYIFYIDGEETWRTIGGGISQDSTTYMIISSEVNTNIAGQIDTNTLPIEYLVDWIHVYNLKKN